jgi:GNAT superfamily N-acetyltransferase
MRKIERAMARNLQDNVAALVRRAPEIGATCIAVAGGVAAFTGPGSPLTTVKGTGPHLSPSDLDRIEAFFRGLGSPEVTIETAPWLVEESKQLLTARGYAEGVRESVVTTSSGKSPAAPTLRAEAASLELWPELMRRSYELPDDQSIIELVAASAYLPTARVYGVRQGVSWIGCAQAVTYDDVVVFGNDGTDPAARGRGVQTALITGRLEALPAGALVAAEVAPGSGSERNYLRCGFQVAYERTPYVGPSG